MTDHLLETFDDGIATLTMNRPPRATRCRAR
jgi:hypothetical protein